jgi:hypothetical protein
MRNPKLINFNYETQFGSSLFSDIVSQHFDVVKYDKDTVYDKKGTVFLTDSWNYTNNKDLIDKIVQEGHYVLFDNLQEANLAPFTQHYHSVPNALFMCSSKKNPVQNVIQAPLYFWFYESRAWSGRIIDYKSANRQFNQTKKFFMPMRAVRTFRDNVFDKFQDILPDAIYSYVDRGISLQDDVSRSTWYWDRYLNMDWYNNTYMSVVIETQMQLQEYGQIFITEKSMKPFAFKHPFMSLSCTGTVAYLKSAGFESFDNIFDESYDTKSDHLSRIDLVHDQIKNLQVTEYDSETVKRIEHNFNWFYNQEEVNNRIVGDILMPIMEKINA